MATRWACPPDSSWGRRSSIDGSRPRGPRAPPAAAPARRRAPRRRASARAIAWRTVRRGLSEPTGSWNTIWTAACERGDGPARRADHVDAVDGTVPAVGRTRPISTRASVRLATAALADDAERLAPRRPSRLDAAQGVAGPAPRTGLGTAPERPDRPHRGGARRPAAAARSPPRPSAPSHGDLRSSSGWKQAAARSPAKRLERRAVRPARVVGPARSAARTGHDAGAASSRGIAPGVASTARPSSSGTESSSVLRVRMGRLGRARRRSGRPRRPTRRRARRGGRRTRRSRRGRARRAARRGPARRPRSGTARGCRGSA